MNLFSVHAVQSFIETVDARTKASNSAQAAIMQTFVHSAPAAPLKGAEFKASLITKLVNFLNASNCAFNIVNNEETKELVEFLRPGTNMPSAEVVKKGAAALAEKGRAEVRIRFPCFDISNFLALQLSCFSITKNICYAFFPTAVAQNTPLAERHRCCHHH